MCIPCSVRSFEDVLVKVHDEVDSAGDDHIEVTLQQEQQMTVVWHDPLVFKRATSIVHILLVINVRPPHEWLQKVLLAVPILIQASRSVVVYHVLQYQLTVPQASSSSDIEGTSALMTLSI